MGEGDPEQFGLVRIETEAEFGAEVEELRTAMESTRRQIADSLDDLQTQVEASLDWKGWVSENPWKAVGYAFALGVYLGVR